MDVILLVKIAFFVPFILTLTIFAIVYMKSGYKNGLWRSLVSLGATVVALLVSVGLGKLLGGLLSGSLSDLLPRSLFDEMGAATGFVLFIAKAAVQVVLTLLFYGLFLVIGTAVLKGIGKRLPAKKLMEEPGENKGLRFAGMGIRALDAVLLTFALLLPLYGPISVALPPVSKAVTMAADTENQAVRLLNTVEKHPVVKAYKIGPAAAVCKGLATLNMDGGTLDLAAITETIEGVIQHVMAFSSAERSERADALEDLIQYLRQNVIEENWCYELISISRGAMKDAEHPVAQELAQLLDMSKEEFKDNGVALLEFIDYGLNNGFMDFYKRNDYESLSPEFYEKLGELINYSDQAIALKKIMMKDSASSLFCSGWNDADRAAGEKAADAFIERYISNKPTEASLRKREGEMFMLMYFSRGACNTLEAFTRHPAIGYAGTKDLLNENVIHDVLSINSEVPHESQTMTVLHKRLAAYETAPLHNISFEEYVRAVFATEELMRNGFSYTGIVASDEMLEAMLQDMEGEFFQYNEGAVTGKEIKALLEQALTEARQTPGVMGFVSFAEEGEPVFRTQAEDFMFSDGGTIAILGPDDSFAAQGVIGEASTDEGSFHIQTNSDGSMTITKK